MISVIIPSYKDPYLHNTIQSLLDNAINEIEVIPVLDGYWTVKPIISDNRIKIVHLGKTRGMRGAINAGVCVASGKYIMRTDEHCKYEKGFDVILTSELPENCIVTARRYFLDPVKWEYMQLPYVDYEKLVIQDCGEGIHKFAGYPWRARDKERAEMQIDETMAMQGSMWVMHKSWWEKVIGELQSEGYGTHYQDSHEMVFKTWKAGGKLLVNKKTQFGHRHRSFPRTHNYGGQEARDGWTYSLNLWKDYYINEIKPKWGI